MKVLKFLLWLILYAAAAITNFFVFAFTSAMIFGESPAWIPIFTVVFCVIAFIALTIHRFRVLFPRKDKTVGELSRSIHTPATSTKNITSGADGVIIENSSIDNRTPVVVSNAQKYCQHCGTLIDAECVVCTACGKQVALLKTQTTQSAQTKRPLNKWISFLLCLFLGGLGFHKFYEGKIFAGLVYMFTCGFFYVGAIIDLIIILTKPNPYYK